MNKLFLFVCLFISLHVNAQFFATNVITGADQLNSYLPLLKDKKVAMLVNQTSVINKTHLVDTLLSQHINIVKVFAPEHGFRGTGDAGEHISSGVDKQTGLTITSMYGASKKPSKESMKGIEIVVFDIQDVGARFYTYISSLQYMMEACAESGIPLLILDRPNPNGFYVDGPVMEIGNKSFIGMQSIPIVHGMTVGEYAKMLNGESLLSNKKKCKLTIIPCKNYTHKTMYELPIPPSPNLRTSTAILLYPSLCLFEGTQVSVGRGTQTPFEIWGHPDFANEKFSFKPVSSAGAKTPPLQDKLCYGRDLRKSPEETFRFLNQRLNISFLKQAYSMSKDTAHFFIPFFEKLAGTSSLRKQIIQGKSEIEIRKSWQLPLNKFKAIRKKYLLYTDFE